MSNLNSSIRGLNDSFQARKHQFASSITGNKFNDSFRNTKSGAMNDFNQSFGVSKKNFNDSFLKTTSNVKFLPPSRFHSSFNSHGRIQPTKEPTQFSSDYQQKQQKLASTTKFVGYGSSITGNKFNDSFKNTKSGGMGDLNQSFGMPKKNFNDSFQRTVSNVNFPAPSRFISSFNGRIQPTKDSTQLLSDYQQQQQKLASTSNFVGYGGFGSSNSSSQRFSNQSMTFSSQNYPTTIINNEHLANNDDDAADTTMMVDPPSLKSFGGVKQNWLSFESSQNSLNKYKR